MSPSLPKIIMNHHMLQCIHAFILAKVNSAHKTNFIPLDIMFSNTPHRRDINDNNVAKFASDFKLSKAMSVVSRRK